MGVKRAWEVGGGIEGERGGIGTSLCLARHGEGSEREGGGEGGREHELAERACRTGSGQDGSDEPWRRLGRR
jgi:hypothetical protein